MPETCSVAATAETVDERAHAAAGADVDERNQCLARIEQIKRLRILDRDLSQEAGELTPTVNIKRNLVAVKYADFFSDMYKEA